MTKYYLDTCIWRDHTENRSDAHRPIGTFATRFLEKIIRERHTIVWSDVLEHELRNSPKRSYPESLREKLLLQGLLQECQSTPEQIAEAIDLSETRLVPASDALHAIISRDMNAVLITRDAHFQELRDIALPRAPEDAT